MENIPRCEQSLMMYESEWLSIRRASYVLDGKRKNFDVVYRSASVVVVPLSPDGFTLLVRQFRYPAGVFSWEFPMGGIDAGESLRDAAYRELAEETGLTGEVQFLGSYRAIPGLSPQEVNVFCVPIAREELESSLTHQNVDDIVDRSVWSLSEVINGVGQSVIDGLSIASLGFVLPWLSRMNEVGSGDGNIHP